MTTYAQPVAVNDGSSTPTNGDLRVIQTFMKNGIFENAKRKAPTVEIMFMPVNPSVAK